jgi:hypothetical protein
MISYQLNSILERSTHVLEHLGVERLSDAQAARASNYFPSSPMAWVITSFMISLVPLYSAGMVMQKRPFSLT